MAMSIQDSLVEIRALPIPKKLYRFKFHGTGGDLFSIFIMNLLKTIVTFGVYYFWGKVKTRQFVWGQTEFAGDRFGYHGMGLELFLGWMKAAFLFGVIVILDYLLELSSHQFIGAILFWTGITCLIPIAQIGALRYRLSRSSWRGVRFSFRGELRPFFLLSLKGLALTAMTLGVFYPFYECESRAYLISQSRFGTSPFQFKGQPKDLFRIYIRHGIAAIGGIVILAAILFPLRDYMDAHDSSVTDLVGFGLFVPFVLLYGGILLSLTAKRRQFYLNHTWFAGAQFKTTITMSNLLSLYINNLFIFIMTLGLAIPWITVRSRRYDCEHLKLTGALNLSAIHQDAQTETAVGEELSSLLDVDTMPG
jgi:uncharacterized membrane protein YjgN (DUF898 family)